MAGSLTHAYFALDLYDKLSIRSKELLMHEKENFKLFSQSTDILFYYKKKDKKMKEFSKYVKNNKVFEFFETLINYIKYNNHQYNSQVIAYLYAMLSHYVLDSTINPYIIYKTGKYDIDNKDTFKYISGNNNYRIQKTNILTFEKAKDARNFTSIIKKCPTCGSSIDYNHDGQCKYCRNIFPGEMYDWVLTNIKVIDQKIGD